MTITIDAAAELLNYHAHTFSPVLRTQLLEGLELENTILSPAMSDGEYYTCERATSGEILQPYQGAYTAKGSVAHAENKIRVRPIKSDTDWTEVDLAVWYGKFLASRFEAGKTPENWTFPMFIMERVIVPKMYSEMNNNAWNGIYAAPTPGTAGASIDSIDGFKKVIADHVTAGTTNVLASGTFTASTIRENVESFIDLLPEHVSGKGGRLLMSNANRRKYVRDYRDEFYANNTGIHANNNSMRKIFVDDCDVEIVGIRAMGASNRFVFIPNEVDTNMVYVSRNGYSLLPQFIFKCPDPRTLKMSSTIYRGYGFEDPMNVWVNNQV